MALAEHAPEGGGDAAVGLPPGGGATPAAREAFYRRHAPLVRAVVGRCRALPAEAREDGVQEAWRAIVGALPGFVLDATRGRVEDWVAAVAMHAAANLARRLAAHPAEPLDEAQADLRPGRESDPAVVALGEERAERVRAALEAVRRRVPPLAYRVFHAHHLDRRSLPAVAAELGLTEAEARRLNRRVVAEFRRRAAHLASPTGPGPGGSPRDKKS